MAAEHLQATQFVVRLCLIFYLYIFLLIVMTYYTLYKVCMFQRIDLTWISNYEICNERFLICKKNSWF